MKREDFQLSLEKYKENGGAMEFLWAIDETLFKPIKRNGGYEIVVALGDFRGNFDYDRGLMVIYFRVYREINYGYQVNISILNIDDGGWRAVSNFFKSEEEAKVLLDRVFNGFVNNFGKKLPSEKELNDFLLPFGMFGHSEG